MNQDKSIAKSRAGARTGRRAFTTAVAAAAIAGVTGVPVAASASPATLKCTAPAIKTAVAHGGTYHFGCSGTIHLRTQLVVGKHHKVVLDGTGRRVTLVAAKSRVFLVNGSLTLTGISLRGTLHVAPVQAGLDGADGDPGQTGADNNDGSNNGAGGDGGVGQDGQPGQAGAAGRDALGGAMYVSAGAHAALSQVTIQNSRAVAGNGSKGGIGGQGGDGGDGGDGYTSATAGVNGGAGGNAGNAGSGGAGGAGGHGGDAGGGAIFNLGTLTVTNSVFRDDQAIAGVGGAGGDGGIGGAGGFGGGAGDGYTAPESSDTAGREGPEDSAAWVAMLPAARSSAAAI
jgi:predicted regulator of Ras-like GTPase activity (Roadblock/LC7/MglB family)